MFAIQPEGGRDPAEVVASFRKTRYQKYLAYWFEYQRRYMGLDYEASDEDDDKPRWWIERDSSSPFTSPTDEVAFRPR